jgi:hypothetical protein
MDYFKRFPQFDLTMIPIIARDVALESVAAPAVCANLIL